jgi:hypothetical protein
MINVTIGESKAQSEKPFPKLMADRHKGHIIEVYEHPDLVFTYIGIHRSGHYAGVISVNLKIERLVDYNEPITIQNA